jgi:bacterioferritin
MAHKETLKNLQKALSIELSAAHQYQLLTHALDDWGIDHASAQQMEDRA